MYLALSNALALEHNLNCLAFISFGLHVIFPWTCSINVQIDLLVLANIFAFVIGFSITIDGEGGDCNGDFLDGGSSNK